MCAPIRSGYIGENGKGIVEKRHKMKFWSRKKTKTVYHTRLRYGSSFDPLLEIKQNRGAAGLCHWDCSSGNPWIS